MRGHRADWRGSVRMLSTSRVIRNGLLVFLTAATVGCTAVSVDRSEPGQPAGAGAGAGAGADGGALADAPDASPGAPDAATPVFTASISASGLGIEIPDDAYQGFQAGEACINTFINANKSALAVRLFIGIEHSAVGDLTIRLVSPSNTNGALLNRPGYAEAADDGANGFGNSANLSLLAPIAFVGGANQSAEQMGAGLGGDGIVCTDDEICEFTPSPGAAPGTDLGDFIGDPATGTWRICIGDSNPGNTGVFDSFRLEIDVEPLL